MDGEFPPGEEPDPEDLYSGEGEVLGVQHGFGIFHAIEYLTAQEHGRKGLEELYRVQRIPYANKSAREAWRAFESAHE